MNCLNSKMVVLVSVLTLCSCNYLKKAQAQVPQPDFSRYVEKRTRNLTPQPPDPNPHSVGAPSSLKGKGENLKPLKKQERGLERGLTDTVKSKVPQQMRPPTPASVLPPQPSVRDLSTPQTYKIETYNSEVMQGSRSYGVALPPGYNQNPNQRYPVIFLLHGGHGNADHWFAKGDALTILQQLYATGKLPPSIVITPDGNDKRGSSPYWDPDYIDGPNGKVSTAIGDELVKVVKARYRTLPNPAFWAIGGQSSGGWGAMNVGLHYLNRFAILFSHSGYFQDKSGPQNSPIIYIKTIPPQAKKRLRVYLDTGLADTEIGLDEAKKFSQVLTTEKIYNMFYQFPGGHTWDYWHEHLADSLTFVGRQFKISAMIAHTTDNLGFDKP